MTGDDDAAPIEALIAYWVDLFRRDPNSRHIMAIARRVGAPFSEVADRWDDPHDLAAELAWDTLEQLDLAARCPQCGVAPGELFDETGREVESPAWRFSIETCRVCDTKAEFDERLRRRIDAGNLPFAKGARVVLKPREAGDPVADDDLLA